MKPAQGAPTAVERGALPLIAFAGNPNSGKTTLFNRLTGAEGRVGNYPGVTVDRHEGRFDLPSGKRVRALDVPGSYSLSARSEEEQIALGAVAGLPPHEAPDVVVLVLDATQLTRNLYLALQVIETDVPVVCALNMVDMLAESGHDVDAEALAAALGVPVVSTCALKGGGTLELSRAIDSVLEDPGRARPGWRWKPTLACLRNDVQTVAESLPESWVNGNERRRDALALWALLSLDADDELAGVPDNLRRVVEERRRLAAEADRHLDAEVIQGRYAWIDEHAGQFVRKSSPVAKRASERIDGVLLHPIFGFAIFLLAMGVLFQSLFSWADPAIGAVEAAFDAVARGAQAVLPAGLFQDFVVGGLVAGVGSVIVFLPQILLLFFFIGLMEDTGYMSRIAFMMDRVMKMLGLHGRAFVPMLSGFACAIPAVMATRTMERRRDRLLTMLVVPLMTCSARLPVYTLVIAALFPPSQVFGFLPVQGLLMIGMYLFSTLVALVCAAVLGRTLLKGPRVPLILELPPYRIPHWPSVLRMMWQKSRVFLTEAGTVILVCTIVLWFLLSFPRTSPDAERYETLRAEALASELPGAQRDERVAELDSDENGARLRASYGGRLGRTIEPLITPLGFDWKIGIGLIGAFAAREVFVSTMGVVYGLGEDTDEESTTLRERIRADSYADGRPVYTPLVGLSLMIFFALACQCMSTLAAVKRETGTWGWPVFLFAYMTTLAWIASFVVYQGGRLLGFA